MSKPFKSIPPEANSKEVLQENIPDIMDWNPTVQI
jgi:hypothetical protein